ncbi:MAG: DHA2 family efflux MFS transporter permease subunit [Alphaproteobacteria bacterium]|nr:DHA2 family efflux MFS transporter permease subunit [Alphaproteobacteria bacterium]
MESITARQWLILLTVQITTIQFGITITSVAVILPQMRGALAATQDQIAWLLTFNMVATAVATPLTGWLAAKLGWRRLMLSSVVGFTASSVLCGLADSLEALLVLRVIQGAFGAPIFPMGQAILLASFSRAQHPFILMMWGVGGVLGPILGPSFGGLIAEALDWRWTFILILPLGVASGMLVMLVLSDQEKGRARPFDSLGFLFIAVAVGAAQLMFDRGQRNDWLESIEIVIEFVLCVTFLYLFVVHTLTARTPLFDPATFGDRNFMLGVTFAFVLGMLQYTPMVLFPPLLQDLRGYPDSYVGFLIAMRGIGNFLGFFVVTQFTRYNARLCLFTGVVIQALAALWMATLDINMTPDHVLWTNLLHGIGNGLSYTPLAVLAFSTLPAALVTQGSALFSLLRNLGSSIFISLTLVVFVRSTAAANSDLASVVTVFNPHLLAAWTATFGNPDQAMLQLRVGAEVGRQAAMIGYINAFYLLTLVPALAAPLVFLFVTRKTGRVAR